MLSRTAARLRIAAFGSLCAILPTACSTVPAAGPSRSAVVEVGTQANAPYLLVPISDFAIQNLLHFPGPSLYGKFGDYRGPLVQRIGVGDTLEVTIYEAAGGGLFSEPVSTVQQVGSHSAQLPPQIVQRDGSITVPYAGRVEVSGRTTPEVEQEIVTKLTGKAIEPQVVVTLSRNIATSITVMGDAVRGARIPLSAKGDRLLDVIADAGGILVPAHDTFIELTRGGKTTRVPYETLLNSPKEDIYARPGDTLTVVRYPLSFTAVGATLQNAVVPYDALGISLEEAIGKAAGFVDERADPEGVFVFRYEPIAVARGYPSLTPAQAALNLVPTVYYINMRQPKSLFLARRFSIHDKDIIYVSNSPIAEFEKLIGLVEAVAAPVGQGFAAETLIRSASTTSASSLAVANAAGSASASSSAGAGAGASSAAAAPAAAPAAAAPAAAAATP